MPDYNDFLTRIFEILKPFAKQGIILNEDSELVTQLGLTSLQVMELIEQIEDHFDMSIPLNILPDIRTVHDLALQLYDTGNSDAMYLAALMADKNKTTKEQLQDWMKKATWYMISEHSVGGLAAETPYAVELAKEWMASNDEMIEAAGWSVYAGYISYVPESELDLKEVEALLDKAGKTLQDAKNRVRYTMNGFVIAVGGYVESLSEKALEISKKIGKVTVYLGKTSCKVPSAPEYIEKMVLRGSFEKRQKAVRC